MSTQYVVIDGPDGVGKSTIIKNLVDYFNKNTKYEAFSYSPSHTEYGEAIKTLLTQFTVTPTVEEQLQLSTLTWLYENVLKHHEERSDDIKRIIFIDRWEDSTAVYQRYVKAKDRPFIFDWKNPLYRPFTQYFILDANDAILDERLYNQGRQLDLYESVDNQKKVREGYREIKRYNTNRRFIDVNGTVDDNVKAVLSEILVWLK